MTMISLLIVMDWFRYELQGQMNANSNKFSQNLLAAQAGLIIAYNTLKAGKPRCLFLQPLSAYHLSKQSSRWWHSEATCHGQWDRWNLQYIIEPLGIDPCSVFHENSVQYYRITARADAPGNEQNGVILQAIVVLPSAVSGTCQTNKRELSGVWQSWRRLT
jgi:hypothetical protein